jgi:hypothetical protein
VNGLHTFHITISLQRRYFVSAQVAFNGGVELGQLTVISAAFLAVGWWRHREWYRRVVVIPASSLIAATGFFWMVQRILSAMR